MQLLQDTLDLLKDSRGTTAEIKISLLPNITQCKAGKSQKVTLHEY